MTVQTLEIDTEWMEQLMIDLLRIPSPSGRTDEAIQFLGEQVAKLGLDFHLNRRGVMTIEVQPGEGPRRAIVVHVDTIGCAVRSILPSGRLSLVPVGTHSARFSEGARVMIFGHHAGDRWTGTILPRKASGHAFGDEVDTQGVGWEHVELRLDEDVASAADVEALGIGVGDFVALHALPEVTASGYLKSRHLDDKAGVAAAFAAVRAILDADIDLPVPTDLIVTIEEEVGHGSSSAIGEHIAELVSIDVAVVAPGQNSSEKAVSVVMQDKVAPFDYHLTRKLLDLAEEGDIPHRRDVFIHYRSDVAAALAAGAETRAALIGPGVDATHGNERTHRDALEATARLIAAYLQSPLTFESWDERDGGDLEDFPSRSVQPADRAPAIEP